MTLLVLRREDERFTSCVVIHGMGGTGKTVTAVAVLQQMEIRGHYSDVFWLTVGADAVDAHLRVLQSSFYTQLTGKSLGRDEAAGKGMQEWKELLIEAIVGKARALGVLERSESRSDVPGACWLSAVQ